MCSPTLIWISLISTFMIQTNCAVTPSISTANATIQKKSNVTYQFEPSDDSVQLEELDTWAELTNSTDTIQMKNESPLPEIPEPEAVVPAQEQQNLYPQNFPSPVVTYNNQFGGPYAPPLSGPVKYYIPPAWIQLLDSMKPPTQDNEPIGQPIIYPTGYSSGGFPSNLPPYIDYEGILVPIQNPAPSPPKQKMNQRIPNQIQPSRVQSDLLILLRNLLPQNIILMIMKWGEFIVNGISVVVLGGILTSAICTLTPICTISFSSLPLSAAFKRNLGIDIDSNDNHTNASTTISRVRRATHLLQTALEKFEQLQRVTGKANH